MTTTFLLGAFMLIGLVPEACAQSASPDADAQSASRKNSTSQRDTYILKSQVELDDWQARLVRFEEETNARMRKDGVATWTELLAALDKAEAGAYKLQTVAADGLEDAKVSYEKATSELADEWQKVRPEDRHAD
jgi:small-conductance mechanosensitive channel